MIIAPGFSYQATYLGPDEAARLLRILWSELSWRQYEIQMFGRSVLQPRLTAWCSDADVAYRYSGLTLPPTPWHSELQLLKRRLSRDLGIRFNSVLVNAYRSGADSMGWHADDEPELGPCPTIASVSLGASRRFLVRPGRGGESRGIDLQAGSLVTMNEMSQHQWQHSIPRTKKPLGLRINLTYRRILK